MAEQEFWETTDLNDMTREQWESLCDGCAKCCLQKLEDEDSGEIFYTDIACKHLDHESCQCGDYKNRSTLVTGCVTLTKDNVHEHDWLPQTCAYRLLREGKPLYSWHPLVSGNKDSVHEAHMSVRYRAISEENVHPDLWEERIIQWVI